MRSPGSREMAQHRGLALVAAAAAAGLCFVPGASRGDGARPVLHKHVVIDSAASVPPGMTVLPGTGGPGDLPRAIVAGGEVLPAPSLERMPGDIPSPGKNAWSMPDRSTGTEGELHYEEVFNPATAPFKRVAVFDRVGARPDYTLMIGDPDLVPAAVHGAREAPDRERFWGSVSLALIPGERADLPSVAAGMRILSYAVEPTVELDFLRDGAENWYVEPHGLAEARAVRLVYLVDAPAFYFRGVLPRDRTLEDVPLSLRPESALKPAARGRVLEAIGVAGTPAAGYAETVDALVTYFRSFTAGDSPRVAGSGGDLFLDLTLSRTGVCRHRAFAFVNTAHALGLPARYVANEAHAFVEVYVPVSPGSAGGWRRIDLGGAASGLSVSGARGHAVHDAGTDPFPRPEEYDRSYSRLAGLAPTDAAARSGFGAVTGLRERTTGTSSDGPGAPGPGPVASRPGLTPTGTEWDPDEPGLADLIPGIPSSDLESTSEPGEPGEPGGPDPDAAPDTRETVHLELIVEEASVLRGGLLTAKGSLIDAVGTVLGHQTILFYLVGEGRAVRMGSAVTDDDGTYRAELVVPAAVDVGKYDVRARFIGNPVYKPALAD